MIAPSRGIRFPSPASSHAFSQVSVVTRRLIAHQERRAYPFRPRARGDSRRLGCALILSTFLEIPTARGLGTHRRFVILSPRQEPNESMSRATKNQWSSGASSTASNGKAGCLYTGHVRIHKIPGRLRSSQSLSRHNDGRFHRHGPCQFRATALSEDARTHREKHSAKSTQIELEVRTMCCCVFA